MRYNKLEKDLYWIGKFLGENIFIQAANERQAEIAERLLNKIITDADIKAGQLS
jgi:hypothetical protein